MKCRVPRVNLTRLIEDVDDIAFEFRVDWSVSCMDDDKYKYIVKFVSKESTDICRYAPISQFLWGDFQEDIEAYNAFVSFMREKALEISQK